MNTIWHCAIGACDSVCGLFETPHPSMRTHPQSRSKRERVVCHDLVLNSDEGHLALARSKHFMDAGFHEENHVSTA